MTERKSIKADVDDFKRFKQFLNASEGHREGFSRLLDEAGAGDVCVRCNEWIEDAYIVLEEGKVCGPCAVGGLPPGLRSNGGDE